MMLPRDVSYILTAIVSVVCLQYSSQQVSFLSDILLKNKAVGSPLFDRENLVGNWVCETKELDYHLVIHLNLNQDGTTNYYFYDAENEPVGELSGNWEYKDNILYEKYKDEQGAAKEGKGRIYWIDEESFDLVIVYNGHEHYKYKNIKRHYVKLKAT